MAPNKLDMSVFINPPQCANNNKQVDGVLEVCQKSATQCCGSCHLVQYCSKECQVADWPHHKNTCKSPFMKGTWTPDWYLTGRTPAFMGGAPLVAFGAKKYLWGNMPALDILALNKNEGTGDSGRDLHLLFAASGDLRNVVKTVVGIPGQHHGDCVVVLNDKEFDIMARNAIMLLVALHFDVDTAVPMIIHIWYSALLPASMVQALQSDILPLVADVCEKIKSKPSGSLQAKTFLINGRRLRLVMKKEEWSRLAEYFQVPAGPNVTDADIVRRRVTLAPERIDYRERSMLQWSPALRQVEMHFREVGVMLPYGCSTAAFDTPNPTLYQDGSWPMKDSSCPRDGWKYSDYAKSAPNTKADEYGALFFYLRDLLIDFCTRIQKINISFQMHYVNAQELEQYVGDMKFDRIEISNICDRGFLGPHKCFQVFSPLLKPKAVNPYATLLMLFLNAAAETEHMSKTSDLKTFKSNHEAAMRRLTKYMPLDKAFMAKIRNADDLGRKPEFLARTGCTDFFKDWDSYFNTFMKDAKLPEFAKICGLVMKKHHTLVERWPFRLGARATQADFELLRPSGFSGYERYMEFERAE